MYLGSSIVKDMITKLRSCNWINHEMSLEFRARFTNFVGKINNSYFIHIMHKKLYIVGYSAIHILFSI